MNEPGKNPGGRPTKLTEEFLVAMMDVVNTENSARQPRRDDDDVPHPMRMARTSVELDHPRGGRHAAFRSTAGQANPHCRPASPRPRNRAGRGGPDHGRVALELARPGGGEQSPGGPSAGHGPAAGGSR